MKKQFTLAVAAVATSFALVACDGGTTSTTVAPTEVVALKVLDRNGGSDLWLTYNKTHGFRFNTVQDGMLHRVGTLQQAQSAEAEPMPESDNPFAAFAPEGSGGGGSALTFSAETDAGSGFSAGTDAGSGFSADTGGSGGFSGSVGGSTGFTGSVSVPLGLSCDASVLCDFFGSMCAGDPECATGVEMCREQINSVPIPAEMAPFVCVLIDFLECVIDSVDIASIAATDGEPSPAAMAAIMSCAEDLAALGMEAEDLFDGGGDSSSQMSDTGMQ